MDPAQEYWQQKIADVVAWLGSYGVDGVYVDQIGCAYPLPCFSNSNNTDNMSSNNTNNNSTSSSSPDSTWASWVSGSQKLLSLAHAALGSNRLLISEGQAEPYLGIVDAYLSIYSHNYCNSTPSYQSVFGGYAALVGSFSWGDLDAANATSRARFAILTAQLFVTGQVGGWGLNLQSLVGVGAL